MKILRKILGAPNALLRALAERAVVKWLRGAGSGEYGPFWLAIYNALRGRKTAIGLGLGCAGFVADGMGMAAAGPWLEVIGSVLMAAGLADKAVRNPGLPAILADNYFYRLAADHAGLVATVLSAAWAYVVGVTCSALDLYWLQLSCHAQQQGLGVATLALVYLGVLDVAFAGKTPLQARITKPMERW